MIEIVCVTVNHSYQTLNVFRKKCWKTKNINKKVLKTLGFQHFLIWQGYKDSNLGHAVLERKVRFQLSHVSKFIPSKST